MKEVRSIPSSFWSGTMPRNAIDVTPGSSHCQKPCDIIENCDL